MFSEACERNKGPILEVLQHSFAGSSQVLEIGSGTGQHAVYFSAGLLHLTWCPTERLQHLAELEVRINREGGPNLSKPLVLDVRDGTWPGQGADALFTANTLHIMSWTEVRHFFRGTGDLLARGGRVCVYGPFRYPGDFTSESNRAFDALLRERDPDSGIRDIEETVALAKAAGLRAAGDHDLPAYNRLLEFVKD